MIKILFLRRNWRFYSRQCICGYALLFHF